MTRIYVVAPGSRSNSNLCSVFLMLLILENSPFFKSRIKLDACFSAPVKSSRGVVMLVCHSKKFNKKFLKTNVFQHKLYGFLLKRIPLCFLA